MKGYFHGVKTSWGFLIAFACTTIFVFVWNKNHTLTTFLQPSNRLQRVSSGVFTIIADETSSKKDLEEKHSSKSADNAVNITYPGEGDVNKNLTSTKKRQDTPSTIEEGKGSPEVPENGKFAPMTSVSLNSSGESEQQVCNLAKGKWVMDPKRPLYSGFGCKQWLSSMWACRLTQRSDFEYESLRWQPKDCQMEEFTGLKFLNRMVNKTIAFIGDSLGRQQFQSLMCMVTGGEERPDVLDVGFEYGLVKARGAIRPDGWAYRFPSTNTTILYYWSASLSDLVPINASERLTDIAMHLDRPPAFLRRYIYTFDVLVLNTGHHWNKGKLKANRWIMHVGGIPIIDGRYAEISGAKNFTVYSIINWLDAELPKYPSLKAFFRSISPRHFFNGDWNTGGTCDNTSASSSGKEILKDESSDLLAAGATKGTKVKLLDITAVSELRDEGHISRYSIKATPGVQDCLHWCMPGVPDAWNEILFAKREEKDPPPPPIPPYTHNSLLYTHENGKRLALPKQDPCRAASSNDCCNWSII